MKVAVLGSGNGGCAVAFDCAKAGHDVALFDFEKFPAQIAAVARRGGIVATGQLDGFAPVVHAGHDIATVLDGAELVFAVGPAYSTEPFGAACRPHLKPNQTVVVCPGSCGGALAFKNALGQTLRDEEPIVAETSTLPYAVRLTGPGEIRVFLRLQGGVYLAAFPSRQTEAVLAKARTVYDYMAPARNLLQTTLQNGNPVIHPAITLLNAALLERTAGDFGFYEEGVTPGVGRLVEAVDRERVALGEKLGVEILPDPVLGVQQGYMREATYDTGYSRAPGFRGIKAQDRLDHRYFNEDVGFGLVFMAELGRQIGVATPVMDAVIALVSAVMGRDYRKEQSRTPASLALGDYSLDELKTLL